MSTHKAAKANTRISGFLLLFVGFLFAVFGLAVSLSSGSEFTTSSAVLLPLFLCIIMEAGLSLLRKNVYRSTEWGKAPGGDAVETIGKGLNRFFLAKSLFKNLMGFVVVTLILAGVAYVFLNSGQEFSFQPEFAIQLATYVAYLLLLRRLVLPVGAKLRKALQNLLATYELDTDSVTFTLPISDFSHPDRKYTIRVGFDEITELKLLNYQEAKDYLKYEFSPDLKKLSSAPKDWYAFMKDNVRPHVYTKIQSGGAAVLVRGDGIFYLITVNKDDCSDLIEAFKGYVD